MRPVLFIAFPSAILLLLIPAQAASDHRPALIFYQVRATNSCNQEGP